MSQVGTLAHAGPLTRTVMDAALTMAVISGWDARDWTSLPKASLPWDQVRTASLAGKRIAYSPDLGFGGVDPEAAALVRRAVDAMAALGAIVEEVDPKIGDQGWVIGTMWPLGCAKGQAHMTDAQKALLEPGLREAGERGAKISLTEYLAALDARAEFGAKMRAFHEQYDFLVLPTMRGTAFAVGANGPRNPDGSVRMDWSPFCYLFNLTQQPAASLPCGFTSAGLPVGLQVVGAMHDDVGVLGACHALEAAIGAARLAPFPT
jgi:aspartyl-tRNA(Asn)/glutamyl-tRNA(Gln) amidotransferase subunit A